MGHGVVNYGANTTTPCTTSLDMRRKV